MLSLRLFLVTLSEPQASQLEKEGLGYVVASVGALGGEMPYTTFNARKSYLDNNHNLIVKFNHALNKGLKYVHENDAQTIAPALISSFPEMSLNELTAIIKRYKDQDAWNTDTTFSEDAFDHLQNVMISAGELETKAPFDKIVNSKFN